MIDFIRICPDCGSELSEQASEYVDGHMAEASYTCPDHGEVGYWRYGHYDPAYAYRGEGIWLSTLCKTLIFGIGDPVSTLHEKAWWKQSKDVRSRVFEELKQTDTECSNAAETVEVLLKSREAV